MLLSAIVSSHTSTFLSLSDGDQTHFKWEIISCVKLHPGLTNPMEQKNTNNSKKLKTLVFQVKLHILCSNADVAKRNCDRVNCLIIQ